NALAAPSPTMPPLVSLDYVLALVGKVELESDADKADGCHYNFHSASIGVVHLVVEDSGPRMQANTNAEHWDAFMVWARKFYTWEDFDREERTYKLDIAKKLREVHRHLTGEPGAWQSL